MATSAEIRNKAAKKLGLFGTGQTLRSEIASDIDDAYTEVYAELNALSLVTWASSGSVPDELVKSVVSLVAFARVDEYSVPIAKYNRIVADATVAESRIRELVVPSKPGVTRIQNF